MFVRLESLNPAFDGKEIDSLFDKDIIKLKPCWYNVEDNLPTDSNYYLVFTSDKCAAIYFFDNKERVWFDSCGNETEALTHWMMLPELPKVNR